MPNIVTLPEKEDATHAERDFDSYFGSDEEDEVGEVAPETTEADASEDDGSQSEGEERESENISDESDTEETTDEPEAEGGEPEAPEVPFEPFVVKGENGDPDIEIESQDDLIDIIRAGHNPKKALAAANKRSREANLSKAERDQLLTQIDELKTELDKYRNPMPQEPKAPDFDALEEEIDDLRDIGETEKAKAKRAQLRKMRQEYDAAHTKYIIEMSKRSSLEAVSTRTKTAARVSDGTPPEDVNEYVSFLDEEAYAEASKLGISKENMEKVLSDAGTICQERVAEIAEARGISEEDVRINRDIIKAAVIQAAYASRPSQPTDVQKSMAQAKKSLSRMVRAPKKSTGVAPQKGTPKKAPLPSSMSEFTKLLAEAQKTGNHKELIARAFPE